VTDPNQTQADAENADDVIEAFFDAMCGMLEHFDIDPESINGPEFSGATRRLTINAYVGKIIDKIDQKIGKLLPPACGPAAPAPAPDIAAAVEALVRHARDWIPQDVRDEMEADARSLVARLTAAEQQKRWPDDYGWDDLMTLLDAHWPSEVFPTLPDDDKRSPGPRIVSLLRMLRAAEAEREKLQEALEWYAEQAEAASRDVPAKKTDSMTAILTCMSLDGGKRARAALASPSPTEARRT
jgi:hypothetical protein